MSRLKNKVAVVTGGTSGIGLGTVKRLVAEGAVAYVFARRKEELEKMAASLGPNVATVSGDVRNLDDLDRLYATIVADGKKLDIVVPNVGAVDSVKLGDVPSTASLISSPGGTPMTQRERKAWNAANRREFIEAGFSRRDLFKMGLLTGAGYLVAKGGLSARADEQTQLRGGQSMIFMVPKFTGAAYFAATEKGAKEAVAELKGKGVAIDFLYTGPSVANTDEEIGMIDDLVAQKADAIIIAPNHADAMVPVAKKASLRSAEMRRIRPFPSPFVKKGLHVAYLLGTAPQIPAFAYTAIAITNGPAGKHWPIAALYPAYTSR